MRQRDWFIFWQSKYSFCVITAPNGDHKSETWPYGWHSLSFIGKLNTIVDCWLLNWFVKWLFNIIECNWLDVTMIDSQCYFQYINLLFCGGCGSQLGPHMVNWHFRELCCPTVPKYTLLWSRMSLSIRSVSHHRYSSISSTIIQPHTGFYLPHGDQLQLIWQHPWRALCIQIALHIIHHFYPNLCLGSNNYYQVSVTHEWDYILPHALLIHLVHHHVLWVDRPLCWNDISYWWTFYKW